MKTFRCSCDNKQLLFFESSSCVSCQRVVGLDDAFDKVEPYDFDEEGGCYFKARRPAARYQKCDNNANYNVCNGMVNLDDLVPEDGNDEVLCFACRFNETVPDLSIVEHIPLWQKMEAAKRRALYTLKALSLPLRNLRQDPENGLSFDFTTDRDVNDHFVSKLDYSESVFTGHDCGHITINLAEADDVARSQTKHAMNERYRTLLGHFRHELGHYYFDQLIVGSEKKHALSKEYFGDDELDYQESLKKYYENKPADNWRDEFISEYATMHPYEDWAETWAHYMHIMDTLETAKNFSITGSITGDAADAEETDELNLPQDSQFFYSQTSITSVLDAWMEFSVILNSLNRSMGMNDAYPFVLSQPVRKKLSFVHHAIHNKLSLIKS
ncbi:MAG: hypothetical protein ACJA1T_001444 [Zhongshania aliphaticivorans]|jgi:hypothetical protein